MTNDDVRQVVDPEVVWHYDCPVIVEAAVRAADANNEPGVEYAHPVMQLTRSQDDEVGHKRVYQCPQCETTIEVNFPPLAAQPSKVERPLTEVERLTRQVEDLAQDRVTADAEAAQLRAELADVRHSLDYAHAQMARWQRVASDVTTEVEAAQPAPSGSHHEVLRAIHAAVTRQLAEPRSASDTMTFVDVATLCEQALAVPAPSGWQPIQSAPKDGTPILCLSASLGHVIVRYDANRQSERDQLLGRTHWRVDWDGDYLSSEPPHWMPLPPAPGQNAKDAIPPSSPVEAPQVYWKTEKGDIVPMPVWAQEQYPELGWLRWKDALPPAPEASPAKPDRFADLLNLPENWDTYGAAKVDPRAVEAARRFQEALMVAPQSVVPICTGGVQIEMHRCGFDFEVSFHPDGTVEEAYAKSVEADASPKEPRDGQ